MSIGAELASLFHRDLTRLIQQLQAFPEDRLVWQRAGTLNSAGNLALHLEGNLREYIGRQLGDVPYQRHRDQEFTRNDVPLSELITHIEEVRGIVVDTLSNLPAERWNEIYPENVLGASLSVRLFVMHLHSHLTYHLGQVDYLRRMLLWGAAVPYVGL